MGPQEGGRVHNGCCLAIAPRTEQEWNDLPRVVAHKGANQLAQVHSQLTHMRHYDDRKGSKTLGWLRQHIMGCSK